MDASLGSLVSKSLESIRRFGGYVTKTKKENLRCGCVVLPRVSFVTCTVKGEEEEEQAGDEVA